MARSLDTEITKLRKRSRILLAQLEENSSKVKQEVKKLCLQTSFLDESSSQKQFNRSRISNFWQLRNNSSGVGGALRPDYFSRSPHCVSASLPNMTMQRRLLLSSKNKEENVQSRKPVKECYCNRLTRKMQFRSTRTKVKPTSCSHCRSLIDLRPMAWVESNDIQPKTSISETVRRVEKINYSPQSEFLQNKISSTHYLSDTRSSKIPSKSTSKFLSKYSSEVDGIVRSKLTPHHSICRNIPPESLNEFNDEPEFSRSVENIKKSSHFKDICSHMCGESSIQSKKPSKETIKRMISSKKSSSTSKDEQLRKTKSGNFTSEGRTRSSQSRPVNEDQSHETYYNENYFGEYDVTPKYSKQTRTSKTSKLRDKKEMIDGERENEMMDLYKFREQNYFDTHGSTQTLLSSRLSGSLERYLLNERLFPQPAGKIHRGDLVVTMPPCATKQRKRIHYFPRYVVRQEKKNFETEGKKKHICPLTGHAIDVGTLKTHHPSNSLALRFQKGVP